MMRHCLIWPVLMLPWFSATIACAQNYDPEALQQAASLGDAKSAFERGTLDYVGIGVVQDYIGAMALLKQAANGGVPEAACEVGFLFQTGSFAQGPPPPDPADAASWYAKAAAVHDACGEFALAALYAEGSGVAKDPARAATLFAAAAAQGLQQDPKSFPLEQLQDRFYAVAYHITGQVQWVDTVSAKGGGGG